MKKYLSLLFLLCLAASTFTAGASSAARRVDVDLTVLSRTIVYAEMYNMMTNPGKYMGKVIKANGSYSPFYYAEADKYYHYLIIADAGGCCEQGFEFIWNAGRTPPGDYPEAKKEIEVVGMFASYEERGYTRYYLATDSISILK